MHRLTNGESQAVDVAWFALVRPKQFFFFRNLLCGVRYIMGKSDWSLLFGKVEVSGIMFQKCVGLLGNVARF